LQIERLAHRLAERDITIELDRAARERLVREGYDPAFGARPLRRAIQRLVLDPLALEVLEGRIVPGGRVQVSVDPRSGEMKFETGASQQSTAA
jgi:ATP-dependent Clp protease ATP-binding subunit ClpB